MRRFVTLTPLMVLAVWLMWQKGCVPKEDVLPTAALTAYAADLEETLKPSTAGWWLPSREQRAKAAAAVMDKPNLNEVAE